MIKIAMSPPTKIKILTFALHPSLEHPKPHSALAMNDVTTIGVIFVVICTVLALAAVVWAFSDGEICWRRRRKSRQDDVETGPGSHRMHGTGTGIGATKKEERKKKIVKFKMEPEIIPNSGSGGEGSLDSVRSQDGSNA